MCKLLLGFLYTFRFKISMKGFTLMKKLFIIIPMLTALTLCGCKESETEERVTVTTAAPNNYVASETDRTVTGEVISITGNEVTLALGTVSEDSEPPKMPENSEVPPMNEDGEVPKMRGDREMSDFGSGERPERGQGKMPDGEASGGGRHRASFEKTGEEASYMIPVGMTVNGLSGRSSDYSGITVGTVLTLTINESGIVCAASIE